MARISADVVNSTLTLNGRTIEDTPEGDVFTVAYQNDVSTQTQGSNNGVVAKTRIDKDAALITVRVLKYSADDAYLTNTINSTPTVILNGSLKTNFTRDDVDGTETYNIINATIQNRGDTTVNNTDGEDIVEYGIFGVVPRSV